MFRIRADAQGPKRVNRCIQEAKNECKLLQATTKDKIVELLEKSESGDRKAVTNDTMIQLLPFKSQEFERPASNACEYFRDQIRQCCHDINLARCHKPSVSTISLDLCHEYQAHTTTSCCWVNVWKDLTYLKRLRTPVLI